MTFIFKKCIMEYMKKYAHKKSFEIKTREADFKDELKASSVLSFMEEVAGSSAEELGFGYKHVRPRGVYVYGYQRYFSYKQANEGGGNGACKNVANETKLRRFWT